MQRRTKAGGRREESFVLLGGEKRLNYCGKEQLSADIEKLKDVYKR
jgi:hypothetical protein